MPNEPGFTQDLYSNLFSGSRIRQLRVENGRAFYISVLSCLHFDTCSNKLHNREHCFSILDRPWYLTMYHLLIASCTVHKQFRDIIPGCHDWYSWGEEETGQYDPGWKPVSNYTIHKPPKFFKSWEYQTSTQLHTYPFVGKLFSPSALLILFGGVTPFCVHGVGV